MEHCPENCPSLIQLTKLEQNYNELKANLQLSAVYGKNLLEEINSLKQHIKQMQAAQEISIQENHNLKMQLEVSQKSHISQTQEMESLKEALFKIEEMNQQQKTMEEEQHRKESLLVSEMYNLKEQEEASKQQYGLQIKELESEIKHLKSAEREPVVVNCSHEEEITQLQIELDLMKTSRNKLEEELLSKQDQIQKFQIVEKQYNSKVSELEYEILTKEKALASSEKLLEEKRVEILEIQALLEAEKVSQTNPEKRGNSIFSEVEDRRQQVERHLAKLTALLDKEKRKNQDLQAEIVKVKNQMAFLACGGSNADSSKSVEQLENLLRSATNKNKDLLKKIENLETKAQVSSCSFPQLEDSRKWMQAMLAQKQEENDKLRSEIRDHIRSYLCQTDQTMQLTKRLAEAEKNLQRARSEVFRLKLKIEEMVTNENVPSTASPIYTVPPTRVVENLQFVVEKKEVVGQPEKPLRERVVLQTQSDKNVVPSLPANDKFQSEEEKDCSTVAFNSPVSVPCDEAAVEASQSTLKRQVRMNNEVHVVYEDGDTTLEILAEDKFTAGAKKTVEKPVGHRVEMVDASKATSAMECNQQ